jgi:hypothetical protein
VEGDNTAASSDSIKYGTSKIETVLNFKFRHFYFSFLMHVFRLRSAAGSNIIKPVRLLLKPLLTRHSRYWFVVTCYFLFDNIKTDLYQINDNLNKKQKNIPNVLITKEKQLETIHLGSPQILRDF